MKESPGEQAEKVKETLPHTRPDGRAPEAARPFVITPGFTMHAEGSVLAATGNTKVICTASLEARVPPWRRGEGRGGGRERPRSRRSDPAASERSQAGQACTK